MALLEELLRVANQKAPLAPGDFASLEEAVADHKATVTYARGVLDSLSVSRGDVLRVWVSLVAVDVSDADVDADVRSSVRKIVRARTRDLG